MPAMPHTQRDHLRAMVAQHGIVRAQELRKAGIAGTTIQRALEDGELVRIGRGLYQDSRSDIDTDQTLAEVAKRVPKGVIAMISALAFHGRSEEHTSELQSLMRISYAVFCLKKKTTYRTNSYTRTIH